MFRSGTIRDPVRCAQHLGVTIARSSDGIEPTGGGDKEEEKAENETNSQRGQDPRLRGKTNLWKD